MHERASIRYADTSRFAIRNRRKGRAGALVKKDGALERLVGKYPSHNFVIDRREADQIFKEISDVPTDVEAFSEHFRTIGNYFFDRNDNFFYYINTELPEVAEPKGDVGSTQPIAMENTDVAKAPDGKGVRRTRRTRPAPRPTPGTDSTAAKVVRIGRTQE
jgi:hypothetical protein